MVWDYKSVSAKRKESWCLPVGCQKKFIWQCVAMGCTTRMEPMCGGADLMVHGRLHVHSELLLLALQFCGNPIQSVWRTRRPWEAMSRSSSALSPPQWRCTSPSFRGRKTLFHSSQVLSAPLILQKNNGAGRGALFKILDCSFFKVALWCFMWAGSHAPELLCVPHWAERTGVSCGHRHKCSDVRLSVCFCSRSRHERWLGAWNESPGTEISVMPRS